MSDDDNDNYTSNQGITLPDEEKAMYNAGLTPLFVNRTGYINAWHFHDFINAGGYIFSSIANTEVDAYYLNVSKNAPSLWPSYYNTRTNAFPLRCLVSTTNS